MSEEKTEKKTSVNSLVDQLHMDEQQIACSLDFNDAIVQQKVRQVLAEFGDTPSRISDNELLTRVKQHYQQGNISINRGAGHSIDSIGNSVTRDLLDDTEKRHSLLQSGAGSIGAATALQQPDASAAATPQTVVAAKEDLCSATALTVKCEHEGRAFVLNRPGKNGETIAIVSGRENAKKIDKVLVELTLDKPLCGKHEGKVFNVSPAAKSIKESGNKAEIELQCEPWQDRPFSHLWLPKLKPKNYRITPSLCHSFKESGINVQVYPAIKWSWDVGINLGGAATDTKEFTSGYDAREHKLKQRKWAISGTVECEYDGKTHKLNPQFERYVESTLESVNSARNVFESVLPKLKNDFTRTFTVIWPNIHFKYTSYFEEQKSSFDVDHVFEFTFGANPIIDIQYEADILEVLLGLARANPSTKVLAEVLFAVKRSMREGVGDQKKGKFYLKGDVAILASIGAKATGDLSIKGRADKTEGGEGVLEISIPLKIEGHAYIEGAFFYVKFKKGYKIGARSGFGGRVVIGKDDNGIYDNGGLFFTGVYLYYVRYEDAKGTIKGASKWNNQNVNNEPSGVREVTEELEWIGPKPSKEEQVNKKRYFAKNN